MNKFLLFSLYIIAFRIHTMKQPYRPPSALPDIKQRPAKDKSALISNKARVLLKITNNSGQELDLIINEHTKQLAPHHILEKTTKFRTLTNDLSYLTIDIYNATHLRLRFEAYRNTKQFAEPYVRTAFSESSLNEHELLPGPDIEGNYHDYIITITINPEGTKPIIKIEPAEKDFMKKFFKGV